MKRQDIKPVSGPRTHQNCISHYNVARPGKTAIDKANGSQRFKPNRRVWDGKGWVKA